jgi:hypothetical protein
MHALTRRHGTRCLAACLLLCLRSAGCEDDLHAAKDVVKRMPATTPLPTASSSAPPSAKRTDDQWVPNPADPAGGQAQHPQHASPCQRPATPRTALILGTARACEKPDAFPGQTRAPVRGRSKVQDRLRRRGHPDAPVTWRVLPAPTCARQEIVWCNRQLVGTCTAEVTPGTCPPWGPGGQAAPVPLPGAAPQLSSAAGGA